MYIMEVQVLNPDKTGMMGDTFPCLNGMKQGVIHYFCRLKFQL